MRLGTWLSTATATRSSATAFLRDRSGERISRSPIHPILPHRSRKSLLFQPRPWCIRVTVTLGQSAKSASPIHSSTARRESSAPDNSETAMTDTTRIEKDPLGTLPVPSNALYGVQTLRAVQNFPISG